MADTINIRLPKAEKERLREAAALAGVSLSAFLRSAAVAEARRVIWHEIDREEDTVTTRGKDD